MMMKYSQVHNDVIDILLKLKEEYKITSLYDDELDYTEQFIKIVVNRIMTLIVNSNSELNKNEK